MTTAAGAGRPLNRFNASARRMSHYTMWIAAWLIATSVASRFTTGWPLWAESTLTIAWFITAFVPLIVSYYGEQVHLWAWDCPTCVARTPILNGDEVAQLRHTRLKWIHQPRRAGIYGLSSLAVYIVAPVFVTNVWALVLSGVPFYTLWIYSALAGETHRNLRPWCRWCHRRGGGDVPVDVVPPTPSGQKTNV